MNWETAATRGPVPTARERWLRQEHDRRVIRLGEFLAEEWRDIAGEFADAEGKVPHYKVLQLMEDAYKQGQASVKHPLDQLKELP